MSDERWPLEKIDDYRWRLPKSYKPGMRVDGIIYADEKLLPDIISDKALEQVANVAFLPGIVGNSLAMPDIHWGYGMPIGGVAAFDGEAGGIISPGMIGYDINCGVRLVRTNLKYGDIKDKLKTLTDQLFRDVPAGVGSKGNIKLDAKQEQKILVQGAEWVVRQGYGTKEDLEHTEEKGAIEGADPDAVSERAYERGRAQSGTLGSGNHFIEVQAVDEIYDKDTADFFNLDLNTVTLMIHSGSRGLGYQICDDAIRIMRAAVEKYGIAVPDRQLSCAPLKSPEALQYISAMKCAANYAWANRQCLMHLARQSFEKVFKQSWQAMEMELIYDVAHNIAKFEKYTVGGKEKNLCVCRKGATRAFGPGHPDLPADYKKTGQPVIIPGDMGRNSYLLVGTKKAEEETFSSTCFTGDTKVLTDKGLLSLREIHQMDKTGEKFLAASINTATSSLEWKSIIETFKREAEVIRICISQTNRSKHSFLRTTPSHNFATFNNLNIIFKEIEDIVNRNEMVCVLDKVSFLETNHSPRLSYLLGALFTDGYIRLTEKYAQVTFTQKETLEKRDFITYVTTSFQEIFNASLRCKGIKTGGGYIRGKCMQGTATDFSCGQKMPARILLELYENLHCWALSLDEESALNFLAGALDGDGTWNSEHHVLEIFNNDEYLTGAIVIACLKLGFLPYISKQRGNVYVIQLSDSRDLLLKYTKRLKAIPRAKKYGSRLFSVRQLFYSDWEKGLLKWPYLPKAKRNNLMDAEKILKFFTATNNNVCKRRLQEALFSCLKMQRVKKMPDVERQEVYNINVEDNHNYIVFTDTFVPVLVKNCHGAGRVMSRSEAARTVHFSQLISELKSKGIEVRGATKETVVEEAPQAYKNVNEVVAVVHGAGISKKVCRMKPLGVVKG